MELQLTLRLLPVPLFFYYFYCSWLPGITTVSCSRSELLLLLLFVFFFSPHLFFSSRILSFFDRLRPNYSTDFRRQLRTVRDIYMFMPDFYARFTVRP